MVREQALNYKLRPSIIDTFQNFDLKYYWIPIAALPPAIITVASRIPKLFNPFW